MFRAISEAAVLFGLLTVFLFLRPILPKRIESSDDREAIEQLIARHGRDPLNDFALLPDKHHHFYGTQDRKCVISYALWREKVIRYLFERFDHYYGYKSLFEFKKKFHPIWRGRHVAYRSVAHLLPAAAAIVRVHLPSGFFKYLRS